MSGVLSPPRLSDVAGDDGHQVGPAAAMSGDRGGEVVLGPGRSAGSALQLVNVANFDAAVRGLRVYPPGDTTSLFVPRYGTGCAAARAARPHRRGTSSARGRSPRSSRSARVSCDPAAQERHRHFTRLVDITPRRFARGGRMLS